MTNTLDPAGPYCYVDGCTRDRSPGSFACSFEHANALGEWYCPGYLYGHTTLAPKPKRGPCADCLMIPGAAVKVRNGKRLSGPKIISPPVNVWRAAIVVDVLPFLEWEGQAGEERLRTEMLDLEIHILDGLNRTYPWGDNVPRHGTAVRRAGELQIAVFVCIPKADERRIIRELRCQFHAPVPRQISTVLCARSQLGVVEHYGYARPVAHLLEACMRDGDAPGHYPISAGYVPWHPAGMDVPLSVLESEQVISRGERDPTPASTFDALPHQYRWRIQPERVAWARMFVATTLGTEAPT